MQTESSGERPAATLPVPGDYLEYCQRSFASARGLGKTLVRLSIAAPEAPLLANPESTMLWCPPSGAQLVGAGQAATVVGVGRHRFQHIKAQAQTLWQELHDAPHVDAHAQPPRLFGGLSFAAGELEGPWREFGHGLFWLPRKLYGRQEGRAFLSLCLPVEQDPSAAAEELALETRRLLLAGEATPRQAQIDRAEHLPAAEWQRRIAAIVHEIAEGGVHKVVAARSSRLHFRDGIELRPALERLTERYADCYCYAFQRKEITFVGASPETLIDKRGLRLRTQALAGSIAADRPFADHELLSSKKDRLEQELVVKAITDALAPACSELRYEQTPQTLTLRHLTHLCTPIEGQLRAPQHVLDLVAALHPTPAVGGSPAKEAMQWIASHEQDRGWYAGPVGWFDIEGDGHFAVAIRSALFTGNEALVYAGAGIVADSDPMLEYQETGLKQRAILDALGILG